MSSIRQFRFRDNQVIGRRHLKYTARIHSARSSPEVLVSLRLRHPHTVSSPFQFARYSMLLAADPHAAIDIDKLAGWLIAQSEQTNGCPDSFCLVDVNDYDVYMNSHLADAYHYDRIMLARLIYETPILAQAKAEGHLLVIYGREAERVANVLFQRGFKTVLLRGNIPLFKEQYPCLLEPTVDFVKLKETYERKRNSVFGGRLWRSTSASRLKSVERNERAERSKKLNRPSSQSRKPWL